VNTERAGEQSQDERTGRERDRLAAQRTALVSVAVRTTLVALKFVFAAISGSMALMADAVHNVSDIAQSLALYTGLKISGRKTEAFPYGLYKVENLISLAIAVLITFVGYELARHAILGELGGEPQSLGWTMAAMVAAMVISFTFSRYEGAVARRTGSPALEADSRDALIDTLATLAVLISLIAAYYGYNVDLWATLLIVAFIIYTAAGLGVDAIRVLLDASVDRELLNRVQEALQTHRHVIEVHGLKGRNSGPYRFIEAHVVLSVHDLDEAHQVSYRLEDAVKEIAPNVDEVLIHFEPERRDSYVYAVPLAEGDRVSDHFGEAERFVLVTVGAEDREVREVRYVRNPHREEGSGKGIRSARMLIDEGVDTVFVREELGGKGPYYALEGEHVDAIVTDAETLPDALAQEEISLEVPIDGAESHA